MHVKILGVTDDVTTCANCGREDLKKTVAIDVDGEVSYYGEDCAAQVFTWEKKRVSSIIRKAYDEQRQKVSDLNGKIGWAVDKHPLVLEFWEKYRHLKYPERIALGQRDVYQQAKDEVYAQLTDEEKALLEWEKKRYQRI